MGGVLSLDQIRSIRSRNEYTEGPVTPPPPPSTPLLPSVPSRRPSPPPRPLKHERTHPVVVVNVNNNNYVGGGDVAPFQAVVQTQPKRGVVTQTDVRSTPKQTLQKQAPPSSSWATHQVICESCGRCKCGECTTPRPLPSRMACGGQCVCSAETALEYATCMCVVKGLFYHCSSEGGDDAGDSCADRPCSLTRPRCPARFLCMSLMTPVFPCLLCYPPCRACLGACRVCHDRLRRPGCRCKNSNAVYRWGGGAEQGHAPGKPT